MEPRLINTLIREHVAKYMDEDLMAEAKDRQEVERARLIAISAELNPLSE